MAHLLWLLLLSFIAISQAQRTTSIAPASQASDAAGLSQIVYPSFAGMGIEPSNLFAFTGGPHLNQLTPGLLQTLGDYSGVPPQLRIGGNSQDNMLWNEDVDEFSLVRNLNSTGSGKDASDTWYYGPRYFDCLNRLPRGSPIVFGLNLAYNEDDWGTQIVAAAKAAMQRLKNPVIISFEIGNEPDLYSGNGFRDAGYGGVEYVREWLSRAEVVHDEVLRPLNLSSAYFEPATTASTIGKPTFEIGSLVYEGIGSLAYGSKETYIAGWNQHDYFYFVSISEFPLTLEYLMNFDNTESQFSYWESQVRIALSTGWPYYLREMASAGPTGIRGISDTFGAALWTLNFFLYTATLNISSVEIHMTSDSWAAPWQPNGNHGLAPYVRPSFYAFAAFAQLIGNCNGTARIAELYANDGNVRAYAVYGNHSLRSIVLINSYMANATSARKGHITFEISVPDLRYRTLRLSELTANGTDSLNGTTWNGLTYSNTDGSASGNASAAAGTARFDADGRVRVSVRDSQAVVANVGWVLGSQVVDTPKSTDPRLHNSKSTAPALRLTKAEAPAVAVFLIIVVAHLISG